MSEWSEDEAFWGAMEPALCAPARLALAEDDVEAILACVEPPPQARVLDLGCGPGAHAIALARRGYRVAGVDTSRRLLDRARVAAQKEALGVEWLEADMREFRRPRGFDLVLSLYASFGYFDDGQNRRTLENVLASLAPDGTLVLDLVGRGGVRPGEERRWNEIDGVLYLERRAAVEHGTWLAAHWIVVRGGTRADFDVTQRLYGDDELRELLLAVGFGSVRLAGSLDGGTPVEASARRLVAFARAPARPAP
jgi:SAM-dependent methyltransferase